MLKKLLYWCSILCLCFFLFACTAPGNPNPGTPTGGIGLPVDTNPDERIVKSDESSSGCAPGSMKMEEQHLTSNGSLALGAIGPDPEAPELPSGVQKVDLSLAQGVYTFRLRPISGQNCDKTGPLFPTITIDFALTYRAQIDRSLDPTCVFRSRADFTQFNVQGAPNPLDAWLLDRMKSNILESLDGEVANQLNQFVFGTNRDPNAKVRCNWAELDS
jgi:hypothetical protein